MMMNLVIAQVIQWHLYVQYIDQDMSHLRIRGPLLHNVEMLNPAEILSDNRYKVDCYSPIFTISIVIGGSTAIIAD